MGKTPSILSYPIRLHFCFVFYLFFSVLYPINAYAQDYIQIAGLIDIRSTFSDGSYSIEELIKMSKDRGFDVVVFTDHDRMEMEYGLFPLRNIIRKRVEYSSVLKGGVRNYLDTIKDMARKYPDMILIPGVESAPFYYWTGSPFKRNLTAHNWEKHLLLLLGV